MISVYIFWQLRGGRLEGLGVAREESEGAHHTYCLQQLFNRSLSTYCNYAIAGRQLVISLRLKIIVQTENSQH